MQRLSIVINLVKFVDSAWLVVVKAILSEQREFHLNNRARQKIFEQLNIRGFESYVTASDQIIMLLRISQLHP